MLSKNNIINEYIENEVAQSTIVIASATVEVIYTEDEVTENDRVFIKNIENVDYVEIVVDSVSMSDGTYEVHIGSNNLLSVPTEVSLETTWVNASKSNLKCRLDRKNMTENTTNEVLFSETEILVGDKYILTTNDSSEVRKLTVNNVANVNVNMFSGYPCEFTSFNKYESHNIMIGDENTTIGDFVDTEDVLKRMLRFGSTIMLKGCIYTIGGIRSTGSNSYVTANILMTKLNDNGDVIENRYCEAELPVPLTNTSVVVTETRVYIFGGNSDSGGASYKVYYSDILDEPSEDDGGYLSNFVDSGITLNDSIVDAAVAVVKNNVYIMGGFRDDSSMSIASAVIDENGHINEVTFVESVLPYAVYGAETVVTKSKVYILGGKTHGGDFYNTGLSAPIFSNGTIGNFTIDENVRLPDAVAYFKTVVTKNKIFLIGGCIRGDFSDSVIECNVDDNGIFMGAVKKENELPYPLTHSHIAVSKNFVYLLGGLTEGSYTSHIIKADISDGWQNRTKTYSSSMNLYKTDISDLNMVDTPKRCYINSEVNVDISIENESYKHLFKQMDLNFVSSTKTEFVTDTDLNNKLKKGDTVLLNNKNLIKCTDLEEVETIVNPFTGYPCVFTHYNKWYDSNILAGDVNTTVGTFTVENILGNVTNPDDLLNTNAVVVIKNKVYAFTYSDEGDIYVANIDDNGVLGVFEMYNMKVGNYENEGINAQVINNKLYMLNFDDGTYLLVSTIDENGDLSAFTEVQHVLPDYTEDPYITVIKDKLYIIDVYNNNECFYSDIDINGDIGPWQTLDIVLPTTAYTTWVLTKNKLYSIGGVDSDTGDPVDTIYSSTFDSNGVLSDFVEEQIVMPVAISSPASLVTKNKVFLFGGEDSDDYVNKIIIADVDNDGNITSTTLSNDTTSFSCGAGSIAVTKSRVYLINGYGLDNIYSAPFSDGWEINTTTYLTAGILRENTLTFNARPDIITSASIKKRSKTLDVIGITYDNINNMFTYYYGNYKKSGRLLQRKITTNHENIEIDTPFITYLEKEA